MEEFTPLRGGSGRGRALAGLTGLVLSGATSLLALWAAHQIQDLIAVAISDPHLDVDGA